MTTVVFCVLPIVPLVAWVLLVGWSPNPTEGDVLLTTPVPLLARIKMLALPVALSVLTWFIELFTADIRWWIVLPIIGLYALMLSIPVMYTLTTIGIRTGRGVFRRWTEFAGVRRSASGALLQGGRKRSSYPIFLSGSRDDDQFVLILKNLVRDSYKGQTTQSNRLRGVAGRDQSDTEPNTTSSIRQ